MATITDIKDFKDFKDLKGFKLIHFPYIHNQLDIIKHPELDASQIATNQKNHFTFKYWNRFELLN